MGNMILVGLTGPGIMGLILLAFIVVMGALVSVGEVKIKRWWSIDSDYDEWDENDRVMQRYESSVSEDEYDKVMKEFGDKISEQVDSEFYLSDEEMGRLIDEANKPDRVDLTVLTDQELEDLFNDNDDDGK